MRLRNRLPANNPIAIDFSDVVFGSMSLASDKSSLQFKGGVKFPGSIEISAAGGISQSPGSVISGQSIEIETTQGGIGFDLQPLTLDVQSDSPIQATAVDGINLASTADMNLGRIQASGGPVTLESGGDIIDAGTEMNPTVEGANIDLLARNGVIGSQENPLSIQTETSQLETGTIVDGLLTAHADSAVFVMQTEGDLRVLSVSTADPVGIVSITNSNGEITNGRIADAYNLNGLSLKAVNHVVQKLNSQLSDDAERTVSAFDNSIEVNYQLYWNLLNYSGATTT
ncbi:MAG: hypothetical protein GY904_06090, partial [Planctomycetaceae bacterium]|nr:hypothetical protein [Planctomycetaceae bacterium]